MIDTMHLFVTKRCTNNCPLCCNNNFNVEDILIPTEEELSTINNVFITGGEPFLLGERLNKIIESLRTRSNIKNIYIYTSGRECLEYLREFKQLPNINGINFSPKCDNDWKALLDLYQNWKYDISTLNSNRLYVFIKKQDVCTYTTKSRYLDLVSDFYFEMNCEIFFRIWTDNIESRSNEIFRRLENYD